MPEYIFDINEALYNEETGEAVMKPEIKGELIRCKDCVHYKGYWCCDAWNNSPGFPAVTEDGFCNMAERRTDAVEVVRCKDCKYYNPIGVCIEMSSAVCEDSFCCWAERRTDERSDRQTGGD